MIGESSGVTTLINNQRIYKENQAQADKGTPSKGADNTEMNLSDRTSFSPEAIALSRTIVGPGEIDGQEHLEPSGKGQGEELKSSPSRLLDIRV